MGRGEEGAEEQQKYLSLRNGSRSSSLKEKKGGGVCGEGGKGKGKGRKLGSRTLD